ncbi:MAG: hypothetical protein KZQ73_09975, partial [Candidatus Thiodiazotropha sp. (ex Semelilucina semeliformis)]|nr:hypothetical protein [Candidatus Thiodiazotropha sp. (ex Myrtea spinifera)]MCU7808177.1 hypothetical protein [Candidatus Thiodiazotropha sp. (ex Semelilucina semeliformis)]MCU7827533.1 hypothetical protein [Candidatus Thiodiazotropha sp. (ex Myrtea sp. 'scaly one' KF741663)]
MLQPRCFFSLLLVLGVLSGCGKEPVTPEVALTRLIEAGEMAVEARDLSSAMALVDPDYSDTRGNGFPQLRGLLAGYFIRHPSIYVISKIDRIELVSEREANVLVYAGLAGSAQEASGPLTGWRGNLLRLDLAFKLNDDGDWLLQRAAWRPARRDDFT